MGGHIMDNFCVCCGAIIPEGRMVCPICEMAADEVVDTNWLKEEEYGRHCSQTYRLKTGRNGEAAVCHLFQSGKGNWEAMERVFS